MKNLKSTDPRKKIVLNLLKARAGNYCSKVTNVKDHEDGNFSGDCHRYLSSSGKYEHLGQFCVQYVPPGQILLPVSPGAAIAPGQPLFTGPADDVDNDSGGYRY